MRDLITKTSEEIMTTLYQPTVFAVDGLLAQGLFILAGSPKVGKSWLAVPADGAAAPEYVLIDGKQVPIVRFSLDDQLNCSAAKIRAKIYQERGVLVPEFKLAP